jgi:primosomal protein N'
MVVVQTRRHDEVIDAITSGDVSAVIADDAATARTLSLPPYGARARVSGEAAPEFVAALHSDEVRVRRVQDTYVLTASDVDVLTRVLRETPRTPGRLRLEVF